ncbi:hypothetical protein [Massilia sp. S19_KUP03_FR1]|uniref:hypothetical protein n=1 Tax=Massilia sp. S19_KUP03_FR1 TaxID=3025503 RepID=UPI002FCCBBF8
MIQIPLTTANGPTDFHVLKNVGCMEPFDLLMLTIDSYANAAVYQNRGGLMMRHMIPMPSPVTAGHLIVDIKAWLVSDDTSPFQGGQLVDVKIEPDSPQQPAPLAS